MLDNKRIMVTGGTGSFGRAFVEYLLAKHPGVARILVFSRSEQNQYDMANELSPQKYPIEYVLGDVRDYARLLDASRNVDILVHAAAMKHVTSSAQNPIECVKTNILGSQNVVDAALHNGIGQVVALSTDKASSPINLYGASKLILEKLILMANLRGVGKFSVVRYANIFGSKGSVVPFFMKKKAEGYLPITHPDMTRFSITMQEAIDLVMFGVEKGWGGEIVVPIAPSYRVPDVAEAVAPGIEQRIIGPRIGDKMHEFLVNEFEAPYTVRLGKNYVICPHEGPWHRDEYCDATGAKPVPANFIYDSGTNTEWLSVEDIRGLIEAENVAR